MTATKIKRTANFRPDLVIALSVIGQVPVLQRCRLHGSAKRWIWAILERGELPGSASGRCLSRDYHRRRCLRRSTTVQSRPCRRRTLRCRCYQRCLFEYRRRPDAVIRRPAARSVIDDRRTANDQLMSANVDLQLPATVVRITLSWTQRWRHDRAIDVSDFTLTIRVSCANPKLDNSLRLRIFFGDF